MDSGLEKRDWILLALGVTPLDRLRLMKALFLVWHKAGRNIPGYFEFTPYLYGPCSFEVYSELEDLESEGLVLQAPHPRQQWGRHFLTRKGQRRHDIVADEVDPDYRRLVREEASFAANADFHDLLRTTYKAAPDFAVNSVVKGA